jgi:LacI family transcriptional regulator
MPSIWHRRQPDQRRNFKLTHYPRRSRHAIALDATACIADVVNRFNKPLYQAGWKHGRGHGRTMKKRPARLRDVAKAAGVSVTAVSRYLNGRIVLPPETAARIDAATAALDYAPNPHARSLSRGRSETIGLVIPDIANPFFARLAGAVEEAADARGLGVVLCATLNRAGRELDYIERLRRSHVDGLLFVTNHLDGGALAQAINLAGRIVVVDEDVPGTDAPKIFCDNDRGGHLAARHLVEAGHRRVAFLGGPTGMTSTVGRHGGFRRTLAEAGAACVVETFGDHLVETGRAAARRFLAQPDGATAAFASSDEILIGFLEVMRAAGVRVPGDLSIVAFDDVSPLGLFDPPITAVRQPVAAMGARAVERLAGLVEGAPEPPSVELLPVELVVRASVAPPAARPQARRTAGIASPRAG